MKKLSKCTRKILSVLLTTLMVLAIFTVAPISASAKTTLDVLRSKYPHGSYWNGSYNGRAWQCHGFALQLGYELTDSDPYGWATYENNNITNYIANGNLKPGDIIRTWGNGHTIMVTNVNGSAFNFVDCNFISSNTVRWDGYCTISNNNYLSTFGAITYIKSSPTNVVKQFNPTGAVDSITGGTNSVKIRGWAFDKDDVSAQLNIHVYVGGPAGSGAPGYSYVANTYRPDVNNVHNVGEWHGYDIEIPVTTAGDKAVYVYAINVGGGENVLLGSGVVNISLKVTNPWITVDKTLVIGGETISFNLGADNATGYTIGINRNGTRIITQEVDTNPRFVFHEEGDYSAYITAYNSVSFSDSNIVHFTILEPQNLGKTFYGVIMNTNFSKLAGAIDDNVVLQTETGVASQVWKFERQVDFSYKIMNTSNGKCLDVQNFDTNVALCHSNDSSAQRWYIIANGNGYYLVPKCSKNKALDIENSISKDGTNMQISHMRGAESQTFSILTDGNVQLREPVLSVDVDKNTKKAIFYWDSIYGENFFDLKVCKGEYDENNVYKTKLEILENTTSTEMELPPGYYKARVDAVNYFDCKNSNIVSFTVPGCISTSQDDRKILTEYYGDEYKICIPNDITDIKEHLFKDKSNITEVIIGNHVQKICEGSFLNCTNLKSIYIPNSVTMIEAHALGYELKEDDMCKTIDGFTIYSHANAIAEKYAKDNGLKYVDLTNYFVAGDVDQNGIVNLSDAELLISFCAGRIRLTDVQKFLSDVNLDGIININDVNVISRFINGDDKIDYIGTINKLNLNSILIFGDIDKNFKIDNNDIEVLERAIMNEKTVELTGEQELVADVNLDGTINIIDLSTINKYISNNECDNEYLGTSIILPDNICLEKKSLVMTLGDKYKLSKTVIPKNSIEKNIWSSSDVSIVTVDSDGQVLAVGEGIATVCVTAVNGKTDNCIVRVIADADVILGDVNGDGVVSVVDVIMMQKIILKSVDCTIHQEIACDINGDSEITIKDVVYTMQKIVGRSVDYPIGEIIICDKSLDIEV